MKLENKLIKLGFNPAYKGFDVLVDCINYISSEKKYSINLFNDIFEHVSKKNNLTKSCIERRIRTLRENCKDKKYREMKNGEMIKFLSITI